MLCSLKLFFFSFTSMCITSSFSEQSEIQSFQLILNPCLKFTVTDEAIFHMYFCKKEIEKHLGWTPFLIITAISLEAMSTVDVFQKTLQKFYGVFFSRWCLDNRLYNCLIKYSLANIDYFEEFLSGNPQAFDFQADKTNISSESTFLKCS